jgi:hypothetical protein
MEPARPQVTDPVDDPASAQYGEWARGQRPQGMVYGAAGPDAADRTPAWSSVEGGPPTGSLENSGSLTGHILAQGRPDEPEGASARSRTVVTVLIVVGLLIMVGLVGAVVLLSGLLK